MSHPSPRFLAAFLSSLPFLSNAATISTDTVLFGGLSGINSIESVDSVPNANGSFADEVIPSGLAQFDPSLGTLTAIRVTASFDYEVFVSFAASGIINTGVSHTASVSNLFHEVGISISQSSSPGSLSPIGEFSEFFPEFYGGVGNPGDGEAYSENFGGSGTVSDTIDVFSLVEVADFIGTGNVQALVVAIFTPVEATFELNNVDNATINFNSSVENGSISIEYEYTPVPEPSIAYLGGLALVFGLGFRRRVSLDKSTGRV